MSPIIYKVAVLIFHGADILDFTGPIEILSHVSSRYKDKEKGEDSDISEPPHGDGHPIFEITTIARDETITTSCSTKIKADMLLSTAYSIINTFDILIVPGAAPKLIHALIEHETPEKDLVRAYARTNLSRHRIIFSICTGAFLLGAAGILPGTTVTTHEHALEVLRGICASGNGNGNGNGTKDIPQIVRRRFVDGGYVRESRVQVVTAGGISSGLDATFYIVCLLAGAETASWIARVMEYGWREPESGLWPRGFAGPRSYLGRP
jgi:transcriptional regulator GlxA family with amidase domain